jgi:plasmid stabilization system protein ParE
MAYRLEYTELARLELSEAARWYSQSSINKGEEYLNDIDRTESYLKSSPLIYSKVSDDVRRAVLKRFPYSLFYTVDDETVTVLSCFHQSREPMTFTET